MMLCQQGFVYAEDILGISNIHYDGSLENLFPSVTFQPGRG
jgi:hypothetical protein